MQALKALVIFMGILIMAGMALLVYGLVTRTGGGDEMAGGQGAGGAAPLSAPFGALDLIVPDGCSIAGSELSGGHLVVRFTGQVERGCQQLVIVDLASGQELGRVKAVPASARQAP
jgi:hypothetical protein